MAESTSGIHHKISPAGDVGIVAPRWQDCLGSPTPFNLLSFAMTAMLNGMAAAHWIDPVTCQGITITITLFFGGVGMVLGAFLEFLKGNTFGFTVFGAYGFYHITYACSVIFPNMGLFPSPVDAGTYTGYFFGWLLLSLFLFTYTLKNTGAFTLLFAIVVVVFIFLGSGNATLAAGHLTSGTTVLKVEGYIAMAFAVLGIYLAVAEINLWYPYPIVVVVSDPLTGEAKCATVTGIQKSSSHVAARDSPSSEVEGRVHPAPPPGMALV